MSAYTVCFYFPPPSLAPLVANAIKLFSSPSPLTDKLECFFLGDNLVKHSSLIVSDEEKKKFFNVDTCSVIIILE
jgi:hypothetical protein